MKYLTVECDGRSFLYGLALCKAVSLDLCRLSNGVGRLEYKTMEFWLVPS